MNILHMFSAFPGYFIDKISKYISRSIYQQFIQHICDARSSKVAVNDHQINHKSSYSLLTMLRHVMLRQHARTTRDHRRQLHVSTHVSSGLILYNWRVVANVDYQQQIFRKTSDERNEYHHESNIEKNHSHNNTEPQ